MKRENEEIKEAKLAKKRENDTVEPAWCTTEINEVVYFFKMNFDGIYEKNYLPRIFPKGKKKINK